MSGGGPSSLSLAPLEWFALDHAARERAFFARLPELFQEVRS